MILFIGMPASGKSTFYMERFFETHVRISMDLLRTRNRESNFMAACLATQQRFVVDNTNPARSDRIRYIEAARGAKFRITGYFFEPDPKASYERNQARAGKRRVPPAGLFGILKRLERPHLEEGFDALFLVHAHDGVFTVIPWQA
jgi:predicted kinase